MKRLLVVLALLAATFGRLGAQAPATPNTPRGLSAMPPADSTAPARRAPRSWTSDRREFTVGDIITVIVDERTAASANKVTTATDQKRRKLGADATLPAPATGKTISIESSNDGESRQRGEASRGNHFLGEISVKVIAVSKEGNLQVKGSKTVDVDKNKQVMTLTGWLRPQDVTATDYAESARIADAQIVYQSEGSLGKPRSGIITRVLGAIWP
jgi:flagellar L-ring protein precursor FlgH